jgi:hypothetical protein
MDGFSFVTSVTGLNRPNTGKEDDDDDGLVLYIFYQLLRLFSVFDDNEEDAIWP